jgi:hypothetical protein
VSSVESEEGESVITISQCNDKFQSVEMSDGLKKLLAQIPFHLLIGKQVLMPTIASIGLFYSTAHSKIIDKVKSLPTQAYFSNHHRKHYNMDLFVQFVYARFFKDYKVIVDFGPKAIFNNFKFILHHIFGASFTTLIKNSDDKFWKLVTEMKANTMVSVFPDRDGALFDLDFSMRFRKGLFAASIFTGIPIIDHVISPKTSTCETMHVDIVMWKPPKVEMCCISDAQQYARWRYENREVIENFTLECEKDYVSRVMKYQIHKVSCDLEDSEALCSIKDQDAHEKSYRRVLVFAD